MTHELLVERDGAVLTVTFNRPEQRNAMTWAMYDGLVAACEQAEEDDSIRVMVLRGAGSTAFVAGTDISQFADFSDGADGIAYERRIIAILDRLESVRVPTIAAVNGFCVGGGLAIAAVCDIRLATPSARFSVPIARTLGNCLAMNTVSLLVWQLGAARTLDLLLRARQLTAEQAETAGFVSEIVAEPDLAVRTAEVAATLAGHAPLTMWAAKEAVRRLRRAALPEGDDIVARVFGSDDFHEGVAAFLRKQPAVWTGH
jgi:enoyl-CoA hydratase/carnithine racemase